MFFLYNILKYAQLIRPVKEIMAEKTPTEPAEFSSEPSPSQPDASPGSLRASISKVSGGQVNAAGRDIHQENRRIDTGGGVYIEHYYANAEEDKTADEAPAPGTSPYRGMEFFGVDDAALFFGREHLTGKLVNRLKNERFLAIVGASGSGKSSLVRAGMVAALKAGGLPAKGTSAEIDISLPAGCQHWQIHIITPTAHPLEALAASLTRDSESVTATTTLIDDFRKDPRSLHLYAKRLLAAGSASRGATDRLLLVVDQFEELFTACKDVDERNAFLNNLTMAVSDEINGSTTVVITLRADFYDHCAPYETLRQALASHQEYIGPMDREELLATIVCPASENGWEFEPGLVELMLRDTGLEPGALPLLSHALYETWLRRRGRKLTLKGYQEAGGVRQAITHTAERVYHELSPDEQDIARRVFLRLTELGDGTQDTRRRALSNEFAGREVADTVVAKVLSQLADARLVINERDAVEVAHEALIREWPRLWEWLDADREGLRIQHQVSQAAMEWERNRREPSFLYSGARLAHASEWAKNNPEEINEIEREFIHTCEQRGKRELRRARQQVGALLVLFCIAMLAAGFAIWFAAEANKKAAEAQVQALAAESLVSMKNYPQLSLLLAVEAVKRSSPAGHDHAYAQDALRQALSNTGGIPLIGHYFSVDALCISPDGRWLASGGFDNTVRLWDLTAADPSATPVVLRGHEGGVYTLAISPDGRWLASGSGDSTVRLWDLSAADPSAAQVVLRGHKRYVISLAISSDGRWLASGSADNTVHLWDLTASSTANAPVMLQGHEGYITTLVISPDGRWLASGSDDSTVRLWDLTASDPAAALVVLRGHEGFVKVLAISPDGRWLASGSSDSTVRLWDLSAADPSANSVVLRGHEGEVYTLEISPDGRWLASGSGDSTVRLWNMTAANPAAAPIVLLGHKSSVYALAISPDGRWLASGSSDSTVRLWMLNVDDLIELACTTAGRNLSMEEWRRYLPDESRYKETCVKGN
jgi:WD40 repeat protein/energy-coupling factor transporter ATP-binding protein EcfA2